MIDAWLGLLLAKMALAAGVVVGCSVLAERAGPLLAAMIATLPISAGPVYVFLALEHDSSFIAAGALASMGSNLANSALSLVYVLLAQRAGTALSLGAALMAWLGLLAAMRLAEWPVLAMACATVLAFGGLHRVFKPYLAAMPKAAVGRPWYAIPLRAACVATLTGVATTLSSRVGPVWSGSLAALPLVLSSLIVILQPRIGGPAMAAIVANSALGLMGLGLGFAIVHLSAEALGSWVALGLGLVFCVGWNLALMGSARKLGRAAP